MNSKSSSNRPKAPWYSKESLREVIFGSETRSGKIFDIVLIVCIVISVIVVSVDSLPNISPRVKQRLNTAEWTFTILFTIEYILRLYCAKNTKAYARSFWGIIDLISFLPTFLAIIFPLLHFIMVVRVVRLMRIFKILSMGRQLSQGRFILNSIRKSSGKILVFMLFVVLLVTVLGCIMYLIEGRVNPSFSSIPRSIYWAIVTLTTVGYGDITPVTGLGQFVSVIIMLLGYSIIAVPTGIISHEMNEEGRIRRDLKSQENKPVCYCHECGKPSFDREDRFCARCGQGLIINSSASVEQNLLE